MAENEGVHDGGTPTAEEIAAAEAATAQAAGDKPVADLDEQGVPWKNRMAEMERRTQKMVADALQAQQQQFMSMLNQGAWRPQQQAPQQTARGIQDYTDDELAQLSSQGHTEATKALIQREAVRVNQNTVVQQHAQTVLADAQRELGEVYEQYPDMKNAGSDLYRTSNAIYQQRILTRGANALTMLDAVNAAIRKSGQSGSVQQETMRRAGVDASQAIGGTTYSRAPQGSRASDKPKPLSDKERELAKRMGVKDPQNSLKRLMDRQAKGQSSVSPQISQALGEI